MTDRQFTPVEQQPNRRDILHLFILYLETHGQLTIPEKQLYQEYMRSLSKPMFMQGHFFSPETNVEDQVKSED